MKNLAESLILLEIKKIKHLLSAKHHHIDLEIFDTVASTNDYLKNLPNSDHARFCLAESQTQGRGRFGREWKSPFAANIYFSCRWSMRKAVDQLGGLSLVVGLSLIAALKKYGLHELYLKWPNDILWQEQKLAGILVELGSVQNSKTDLIIGIGLNVNMPSTIELHIDRAWTSLQIIYPKNHDRNVIVALMIDSLIDYLEKFERDGFAVFGDDWQAHDYLAGKEIRLRSGNDVIAGIASGVDDFGRLLLTHEGKTFAYSAGEASLSLS